MNEENAREYAVLAIEKLCDKTRTARLSVDLTETNPSIFESKIGGTPYLPKDADIPVDKNGRQMRLLAQFNCNDFLMLEDYPHVGILQFWLTVDHAWDDFSVKYYGDIDTSRTENDVLPKAQSFNDATDDSFPVNGEYGVNFTLGEETMSRDDPRLEALFCQCYTEISGEYISNPEDAGNGEYGESVYEVFEGYCDETYGGGSKIGGYEGSSQLPVYHIYRPKEYATRFNSPWKNYIESVEIKSDDADVLLFQLDSHYRNSSDYKVLWGDAGVGRFYIKYEDLKKADFSKVWFSWDCS